MGREGYIRGYRKVLDNPIVCKDAEHFAIWHYLMYEARWQESASMFGGKKIVLKPGQLTTGRKQIASLFNISESKVQRVLKTFEIEQQIEQQTSTRNRLITIIEWDEYQANEQQPEQQVNNNRTTSEQQPNTPKERNKEKKKEIKNKESIPPNQEDVVGYIREKSLNVDADYFMDYYEGNGWYAGTKKMKSWKATLRNWHRRENEKPKSKKEIDWSRV
jgi:hypothetical protein